jgi:crossover junction endodeoxyribonuclease RuvC
MYILAIDPGYGRCGVAVLKRMQGGKHTLLFSTCIETSAHDEFPQRLSAITTECERVIDAYAPTQFAIEKLYFKNNQKTAMRVAEVRGALINIAAGRGMSVHEYTPPQVKSAVAGWGNADKKQIITMVRALITISHPIQYDDEYDAIAIGLTHFALTRHN